MSTISPSSIQDYSAKRNVRTPSPLSFTEKEDVKTKLKRALRKAILIYGCVSQGARPVGAKYQSEIFDSQHRYGREIQKFFDVWKSSHASEDFDHWMHKLDAGEEVSGKKLLEEQRLLQANGTPIAIPKVSYFTKSELPAYELHVDTSGCISNKKNGLETLFHSKDDTKESAIAFVISPDNKMYVAPYERGALNHTSFLAGGAALCAGVFHCTAGKITSIWDDSGHYNIGYYCEDAMKECSARSHMLKIINFLQEKGADLSQAKVMINQVNGAKWSIAKMDITSFLQT